MRDIELVSFHETTVAEKHGEPANTSVSDHIVTNIEMCVHVLEESPDRASVCPTH